MRIQERERSIADNLAERNHNVPYKKSSHIDCSFLLRMYICACLCARIALVVSRDYIPPYWLRIRRQWGQMAAYCSRIGMFSSMLSGMTSTGVPIGYG